MGSNSKLSIKIKPVIFCSDLTIFFIGSGWLGVDAATAGSLWICLGGVGNSSLCSPGRNLSILSQVVTQSVLSPPGGSHAISWRNSRENLVIEYREHRYNRKISTARLDDIFAHTRS